MNLLQKVSSKAYAGISRIPGRSLPIDRMDNSGQASIEFILVLLFMLVMVISIVIPLGQTMQNALQDVSTVGSLSSGSSKIQQSISLLTSIPGDSRQVMDIYLPRDTNWLCDPAKNEITITFALNSKVFDLNGSVPANCTDSVTSKMTCVKRIVVSPHDLSCQGQAVANFGLEVSGAGFSQRFAIGSKYQSTTSTFSVDFNATA